MNDRLTLIVVYSMATDHYRVDSMSQLEGRGEAFFKVNKRIFIVIVISTSSKRERIESKSSDLHGMVRGRSVGFVRNELLTEFVKVSEKNTSTHISARNRPKTNAKKRPNASLTRDVSLVFPIEFFSIVQMFV